ncbi:ribosomal subunit interface protein [Colwellia chukchiensis]|uniref:Ribosome hibernation promoting factor n=1 Tax=Colwellia chukchiensis TaxID=641665 RepID=A0A1H7R4A3_9GAMM|nr:ribosome-associated translation inhibitor RaiA [Colwellia chukchiensis]SEL54942.1 ribosomal subunit interface protein [Colwellia chukchiensis]
MKINISGHHVEITEGINLAVENKFAKVAKHFPSLMTLDVIVTVEPNQQKIEATTSYEGATVSVNATDKELYAAIASAATKLEKALAHRKGVLSARKNKRFEVEQSNAFESV